MSQSRTLFIGMDVHNETIAVAYITQDHGADVTSLGTIGTRQCAIDQLVRKMPSQATHLLFVDAAGPCGSWLSRSLRTKGHGCWVVAPSLLPKQAGDRVKTDRRDAIQVARLMRAGDLTPVSGPAVHDDALRDLSRAREETRHDLKTATFRLQACLLRHALRSTGRATWGPAHLRWLREVVCPTPAPPIVFHASVRAVTAHTARLQRLAQARREQVTAWRLGPVVDAWHALRGVQLAVAVTPVAALGDLTRFENPRQRMHDLGLTPSEYASGEPRRQGGITQTGPTHARRALVEGAWASRSPAKGSRHLPLRLAKLPKPIQDVRWKAQVRLGTRSRQLSARGKNPHQVVVAMARELRAFLGAMAQQVPVTAERRRLYGPYIERSKGWQGKVPKAMGREAAPVWCHPRRREEVKNPRS